ncbi:hypothetical protein ACFLSE_09935, partial [Bacteroidota bacterium]
SKYSNINSEVIEQLLKQKIINKYFKNLAILVSTAIIFQFLLIIGYEPTFISTFIFTISVLITLLAFTFFGRYSLIYFNAGNLVIDLISECNFILNRGYYNKKYFYTNNGGKQILYKVNRNIQKIRIIVEESSKPQLSNTALDEISEKLISFAIRLNSFKHTFPSNKGWHLKTQKFKSWDEASSTEYQMYNRLGAMLPPEIIDNYFHIEEQIIETQFLIFNNIENLNEKAKLIYDQGRYLQVISFQCETNIFIKFFNSLESLVDNYTMENKNSVENKLQLVSIYSNLMIQYLVGFNYNFERLVYKENLKKLANCIHNFKDTDTTMQFPYKLKVWVDEYQQKLQNEKYNEENIETPLFYTEFELAYQFQQIFKSHITEISKNIYKRAQKFAQKLKDTKHSLEALEFLIELIEVYHKVNYFSNIIKEKVETDIDSLNLKKEKRFLFEEREKLLKLNNAFKENLIKDIWELGYSSYLVKNTDLPDIYGNFYQIICEDILDKAFKNKAAALIEYLPKFYAYNMLYIDNLKAKIDEKRYEFTTSKIFPIIVDLFEISAITILLFKMYENKDLEESFFKSWDKAFVKNEEKEKQFWTLIFSIYKYFNQPIFGLSTPSYVREYKRKGLLESFLKNSEFIRRDKVKSDFIIPKEHYVTDINDAYLMAIVNKLDDDGIGLSSDDLSDVFIEYFLRTRIVLKDLKIKETMYGSDIRRSLERDS